MKKKTIYIWGTAWIICAALWTPLVGTYAQQPSSTTGLQQAIDEQAEATHQHHRKSWELGIGATGLQLTRFGVLGFYKNARNGYNVETSKRDLMMGGQLYVARELNQHFFLDLQGVAAYANDPVGQGKEAHWVGMAQLGLQWRLGAYFHSPYIDPYVRIGAGYMYKNFSVAYNGLEKLGEEDMAWGMTNDYDKEGADRRHLLPLSAGAGVNLWLNDRFGMGLQAEYLVMPYRQVSNVWQGSVRLMWRIGGRSKKPQPEIRYVEVERIVERPTQVVERIVEKPGKVLYDLFDAVTFDFAKDELTAESQTTMDEIAALMKHYPKRHFLITGCTDARGSIAFNEALSARRARTVAEALIARGVPAEQIKHRGVGKRIAYAAETDNDLVRRGDRKILVEVVNNMDYWNQLP